MLFVLSAEEMETDRYVVSISTKVSFFNLSSYKVHKPLINFEPDHRFHQIIELDWTRLYFEQLLNLSYKRYEFLLCFIERNDNEC